jgi:hypothetical protein
VQVINLYSDSGIQWRVFYRDEFIGELKIKHHAPMVVQEKGGEELVIREHRTVREAIDSLQVYGKYWYVT